MPARAPLQVQLPDFQGPLDLLLHLIQKNEMDIHSVSIAQITDQYLAYIELMQELDLDVASEYLLMASTLLYLKSQSVLPSTRRRRSEGHPDAIREALVQQLLEYKRVKVAADYLESIQRAREEVFSRPPDPAFADQVAREYRYHASLADLIAAFRQVLARREERELLPDFPEEIQEEPITVEAKMREILLELETQGSVAFGTLLDRFQSRLELIATFLAILELVRLRQVFARQEEPHGPITLELNPERPDISSLEWTSFDEPAGVEAYR
ncbi:MAG: segregation and condensation protein A [Candidatus Poribacteria bacterium]|nr:MAG: segregation and condensation protein A [Candidatus Poribacteria bacterium]